MLKQMLGLVLPWLNGGIAHCRELYRKRLTVVSRFVGSAEFHLHSQETNGSIKRQWAPVTYQLHPKLQSLTTSIQAIRPAFDPLTSHFPTLVALIKKQQSSFDQCFRSPVEPSVRTAHFISTPTSKQTSRHLRTPLLGH